MLQAPIADFLVGIKFGSAFRLRTKKANDKETEEPCQASIVDGKIFLSVFHC